MRFLIYGEDDFRARRTLAAARAQFLKTRDPSGLNVATLRAASCDLAEAEQALFAAPFLAERRLTILDGFLSAWPKEQQEHLAEMAGRLPETTAAIFFEAAGAGELGRSPLFQGLAAEKFSVECPALNPATAQQFACDEAASAGMPMSPAAARTLVTAVGTDAWRLHGEAAKLAAYVAGCGRKEISEGDVRETVTPAQEEPIFAFLDHCAAGRGQAAAGALERLFESGMAESQAVAMLLKHFRLLACAADLREAGLGREELAGKLGVHPYAAGKALQLAGRFSPETLADRYRELVSIDRDLKTGGGSAKPRLVIFAARLGGTCAV
ncbi:MAG: DNA polymerase III subunit delta [Patescibacteria group bacterium]|nr:DNA polymerase III subunit delta [Patescibacteria group bacterium]